MPADPRIVRNPKRIRTITYSELRELSYMGASVLHEEAIFPVREANIPINILNTNQPDSPGTIIVNELQAEDEDGDIITGIAGSSPAFIYLVIDAMADSGVLNGLSRADSIRLAAQSVLGAAKMVLETGKHPDVLRDEVCSPGGTTIVGVRAAEDMGLRSAMIAAVDSTIERSREMSRGQ